MLLSSFGAGGALLVSALPTLAASKADSERQNRPSLSLAVVEAAREDHVLAMRRMSSKQVTASDLRVAAASTRTLFRHCDEIGLTAESESWFAQKKDQMLATGIDDGVILKIYEDVRQAGAPISFDRLRARFTSVTNSDWVVAAARIEKHGIHGVQELIVTRLNAAASTIESRETFLRVRKSDDCEALKEIINMLGWIIALNTLACLYIQAFCVIAAIEGIIYATLVWASGWAGCEPMMD